MIRHLFHCTGLSTVYEGTSCVYSKYDELHALRNGNLLCSLKHHLHFLTLQLAMASMASMDMGADGQPVDMKAAQVKFKV